MLASILRKLNEPFPNHESVSESIIASVWIGLFVAFFLFFFMPIGPVKNNWHALAICGGFGVITFVCAIVWDVFLIHFLKLRVDRPSWTLWKWILSCIGLICFIAAGNLLFVDWLNPNLKLSFSNYLEMLRGTLMVGIFPVVISGLIIQVRANERHRLQAEQIDVRANQTHVLPITISATADEQLEFDGQHLLYIEAMQNYVEINLWLDGKHQRHMVRSTLTAMEKTIAEQHSELLTRCHRSYLVNLSAVERVSGNAQGLKLSLSSADTNLNVPVSRAYIAKVRELLAQ